MNILLTHWYSRKNKGDAAIASVMIQQLRKVFPHASMRLLSMEKEEHRQPFENVPVIPSFFSLCIYRYHNPIARIVTTLFVVFSSSLWALVYRLTNKTFITRKNNVINILKAYAESDLIIAVGGGYLSGNTSLQSSITLLLHLHAILIGIILKKKVILFAQSIGPFKTSWQKTVVALILKKVSLILVRDKLSKNYLLEIGIPSSLIKVTADAAFLFGNKKNEGKPTKKVKKTVGITIRRWFNTKQQKAFEKEIALFVDYLILKNYNVVFLPQVTTADHNDDDRVVARRIYNLLDKKTGTVCQEKDNSYIEIYKEYAKLDMLVGMRMHSNIFALTAGVPVLAIAYEHKTTEIMKQLGLSKYVIPAEKTTAEQLIKSFDRLIVDHSSYKRQLKKTIPEQRIKASYSIKLIRETVNRIHI